VRPFVWVIPLPPVGRFLFRFPATFILCHLSVVCCLCCGALSSQALRAALAHSAFLRHSFSVICRSFAVICLSFAAFAAVLSHSLPPRDTSSPLLYPEAPAGPRPWPDPPHTPPARILLFWSAVRNMAKNKRICMPRKRSRTGDGAGFKSKRAATGQVVTTSTAKPPAPDWIIGRPCRVRMLGTEVWRSGRVKAICGLNKWELDLELEDHPDFPSDGRAERVSLDVQPVHIAEDFVWAIEPADASDRAAASGNERTPALLFQPFGPPERESCGPKHAPGGTGVGEDTPAPIGRVTEGEFVQVEVAEQPSQVCIDLSIYLSMCESID